MKRLLKRFLNRHGYTLLRTSSQPVPEDKYLALLCAYADVLRRDLLTELPAITPQRARQVAQLTGITEAQALLIVESLESVRTLDGDVCEFGVAQGATSALIAQEILTSARKLWLFDSFEGLPKPAAQDRLLDDVLNLGTMDRYEGQMKFSQDLVRARLDAAGFPPARTELVPGFIDQTLASGRVPAQVAFAFVDLDLYEPIRAALEFLDGVLVPGGRVVVHDYGYFSTGVETAVNEFLASRPDRYHIRLPEGPVCNCCALTLHTQD